MNYTFLKVFLFKGLNYFLFLFLIFTEDLQIILILILIQFVADK